MQRLRWSSTDAEIVALALPALGALIAEPLYVLADTAVVGHLGTEELGGLALASVSLLTVHAVMIFLAYGTTSVVARLLGAGDQNEAARQGVQALWLAAMSGAVLAAGLWIFTDPLLELLAGSGRDEVIAQARIYLRISLFGLPAMLMMLAGVGYLRGLQDTTRPLIVALATAVLNLVIELVLILGLDFGIGASALSTVVAQYVGAGLYTWWVAKAVAAHGVSLRPDLSAMRRSGRVAWNLFVRTAALRASFTVAVAGAARIGETELAAHEIVFALWFFSALALDAVAIAGQAMIGTRLGAGDAGAARSTARRVTEWGIAVGMAMLVVLLAAKPFLPQVFTDDPGVLALSGFLMWHLIAMQPLNGLVFALDGILIGAGDLRFLAYAMAFATALFVPLALAVPAFDLGIGWLWGTIWVFMVAVRSVPLTWRLLSDRWIRLGAS